MVTFLLAASLLSIMIAINVSAFLIGYWLSFLIRGSKTAELQKRGDIRTLKSEQPAWARHTSDAAVLFLEG